MDSPRIDDMLASLRIEYEHANAQFRSDHATLFTKRNDTPQEIIGVPDGGENIKIFKDVSRVPNITLNFAQSQSNIISPLIFDFDTPTSECVSPNILSEFPFSIDDQSNHAFPQASSSVYGDPPCEFVPIRSPLSSSVSLVPPSPLSSSASLFPPSPLSSPASLVPLCPSTTSDNSQEFSPLPSRLSLSTSFLHAPPSPSIGGTTIWDAPIPENINITLHTPDSMDTQWLRLSPASCGGSPSPSVSSISPDTWKSRPRKDGPTKTRVRHECPFTMCCTMNLARLSDLYRHIALLHLESDAVYACPKCDARFSRHDSRERHLGKAACGKRTSTKKDDCPADTLSAMEQLRNSDHPAIVGARKYLEKWKQK